MDIEALKTFLTLADTKNFTRASHQLFIAQSTVTNRISELEKELNFPLFELNNRNVELTVQGEQFLLYAKKVLKLTETTLAEISSSQKYDHHLRIGSSDSIYEAHLVPYILDYKKKYPNDALKITIGLSTHLLEQLQNDIFDIIFSYLPLYKSQYHCEIFKQDPMVLVTDYANTSYKNGMSKHNLLQENYLMCNFALQDVGQFIRGLFPKFHQFSLEIDDCSKIIPFLLGQNAYTFLPKDMATPYILSKQLRIVPLSDFQTPIINSYLIGNKSKQSVWGKLLQI